MTEAVPTRAGRRRKRRKARRYGYQLTIGSEPRFVWFRNAKVGTRTILAMLREAPVSFEAEQHFEVPFDPALYQEHFKFAMVRNPWERFVSGWRDKIVAGKPGFLRFSHAERERYQDFGEFARFIAEQDPKRVNIHFRPQSQLIDLNAVDYIGRFENFEAEIRHVFEVLGLPTPAALPHKNRTHRRKPYPSYYDAKTRELIAGFYQNDVEIFGYRFDGAGRDG